MRRPPYPRAGFLALALLTLLVLPARASAQQPVEGLGLQLRLTHVGEDADQLDDADTNDIAHAGARDEYLVVFRRLEQTPSGATREIFAQRLTGDGAPLGGPVQVTGLAGAGTGEASQPSVAYSERLDRYAVAFVRSAQIQLQQLDGEGRPIRDNGTPGAQPRLLTLAPGPPQDPDVVFRPDATGDTSPGDRWITAYTTGKSSGAGGFEIGVTAADPRSTTISLHRVSDLAGDARDPSLALVPGGEDLVVAFEGVSGTKTEIFARRLPASLGGTPGQTPITTSPGVFSAFDPALVANPDASQLLVAFTSGAAGDGLETVAQRLDFGLGPLGDDQIVSSAGPPGTGTRFSAEAPAVAYDAALRRYLIGWIGNDTDRPGLSADEREVQATTLDATGAEGTPQDFLVSRSGADNDDNANVLNLALAADARRGGWHAAWTADDPRPPLVDNHFEIYGRRIGENFDVDGDGSPVPADCDDRNGAIRPGAPDVLDNGVDEDCSGADGVNLDRDADGSLRPADCDDANAAIAPGKTDVPNNDVDEDCSGAARRVLTGASIERFFKVFRNSTQVTKLRVTKAKQAMKVRLRCTPSKGKGCPKKLRGNGRSFTLEKAGAKDLTKHISKARLKPGAVLEVRILESGAIGRLDRFTMRKAKLPKRTQRCIPFGTKSPAKCG